MNKPNATQKTLSQWLNKGLSLLPIGLVFRSSLVALVMSLFFCLTTDQLTIWPSLYPKAALVAIGCNLLLNIVSALLSKVSPHTKAGPQHRKNDVAKQRSL